ncbi:MAG: ABC transporter ATP-binding protein [TACK group archaeon]|nr:ABC transporter ATP-binding protein [TACK group archaeon]
MEEMAVEVNDIRKRYTVPSPSTALDGVSFSIPRGEVFGLLGENGAGKTTLIRILSTLILPDEGRARVAGHDVVKEASLVRKSIGYAGQDSEKSAYWRLTARQNLMYFSVALRGMRKEEEADRVEELAQGLGFSKLDREFSSLSGGEKQMVIIMRSLVHDPRVVFMDEPSKSLDPLAAMRVRDYIRKLVKERGLTLLLTTHNMEEAEDLCDEMAFLERGKVIFVGSPREFKEMGEAEVIWVDRQLDEEEVDGLPGLLGIRSGATTKLFVRDATEALPYLLQALKRGGKTAKLRVQGPTLEDAYFRFAAGLGGNRVGRVLQAGRLDDVAQASRAVQVQGEPDLGRPQPPHLVGSLPPDRAHLLSQRHVVGHRDDELRGVPLARAVHDLVSVGCPLGRFQQLQLKAHHWSHRLLLLLSHIEVRLRAVGHNL